MNSAVPFSQVMTPGDIVELELFKWLHWGLGNTVFRAWISNDQLQQCTRI